MTNQRFSLSRLTLGGLLVLAACGAHAQDSAHNPNPFQPPQAASAAPSAGAIVLPPATAARQAPESGALTLPPPIPVPLEKMLPQLPRQSTLPTEGTAPTMVQPGGPAKNGGDTTSTAKTQAETVPGGPPKVRAFLPREKIEANRARCQVSFKGRSLIQLAAGEVEQIVQMTGANGCLTAISADADWLDVEYQGNNELLLFVEANTDKASRRGKVTIVTPNQTFVLTVRQAAEATAPASVPKATTPATSPAKPVTRTPKSGAGD